MRVFGAFVIASGMYSLFLPALPIAFGNVDVLQLKGWWKLIAIVPIVGLGICMVAYAPQMSCFGSKAERSDACRQFLSQPSRVSISPK